jgi:hypothetical protein
LSPRPYGVARRYCEEQSIIARRTPGQPVASARVANRSAQPADTPDFLSSASSDAGNVRARSIRDENQREATMQSRFAGLTATMATAGAISLLAILTGISACNGSDDADVPAPGNPDFQQMLVTQMRSQGMEVSLGYPKLWTAADCADNYRTFHNCFGNNPASPYILPIVKFWPEEYVDPAMKDGFGPTLPGFTATYRLDPTEAIVVYGRMPPKARYLGLQTELFSRGYLSDGTPWDAAAYEAFSFAGPLRQYLFATVPGNQSRVQSFSSVDNNINNVVMERQSGAPWDQIRYFVITPDQATDAAVRAALNTLGVDNSLIFTEKIPSRFAADQAKLTLSGAVVGPLGLDAKAADFFTALRFAMADDEQAGDFWRETLPLTVMRVRPSSKRAAAPYGDRIAEPRTAVDESFLSGDLQTLITTIAARAPAQGLTLDADETMKDLLLDLKQFGPQCREIGMNCLGDNQDASYFLFPPAPLDTGKVYAVAGTLATETGNGTYVGLSVNDASLLKGVINVSDLKLKGSANAYTGVANRDKFFVHFFTRDCAAIAGLTDGACTTITPDLVPLSSNASAPGDPTLHGYFSAAVRAYVVIGSTRGADSTKQLKPHVLTFSKR